jgi:hypothetical protein
VKVGNEKNKDEVGMEKEVRERGREKEVVTGESFVVRPAMQERR